MKKLLKKTIKFIIFLISPKFLIRVFNLFNRLKNYIVWLIKQTNINTVGKNSHCGRGLYIHCGQYIKIGDNFNGGNNLTLDCYESHGDKGKIYTPELIIGNNVTFSSNTQISCVNKIVIGDNCLFGRFVYISDNTHGRSDYTDLKIPPIKRELSSKGPVIIGKNVWVGRCSTILSGITVGDNAVIGANSVVNKDVPANTIVAGVPAKVIKEIKLK